MAAVARPRTPKVMAEGEWYSPEEEASYVAVDQRPATHPVVRAWQLFLTGGMFTVFVWYAVAFGFISEMALGWSWWVTLPALLAVHHLLCMAWRTEMKGMPDKDVRGEEFMSTLVDYLRLRLVLPRKADLDPDPESRPPSYVFGMHPHGIHPYGLTAMNFSGNALAKTYPRIWHRITGVGATAIFRVPLVRGVMLAHGYRDASRESVERILDEGRSVLLVVGGEQESVRTRLGEDRLWMRRRKGFIRLAMRKGTPIVPVYSFGLTDLYWTLDATQPLSVWLAKTLRVVLVAFFGVWGSPIPHQRPVTTVVGEPIPIPQSDRPSSKEVERVYNRYIEALQALFEANKKAAGYPDARKLTIDRDPPMSEEEMEAEDAKFYGKAAEDRGPAAAKLKEA